MIKKGETVQRNVLFEKGFTKKDKRLSVLRNDHTINERLWVTTSNDGQTCIYHDLGNGHCVIKELL